MVRGQLVRGVSHQCHPPLRPAAERRTMEETPTIADWLRRNHLDNRWMPLSEVPELLALSGGHDPLAFRPWCRVTFDQQKVDVVVAHGIVQQMAAWPHPVLKRGGVGQPGDRIHRDDAAEPARP
jgi:hypothetical protein